ncbi:MAG TPA: M67 family metallopeptidase [Puia sp.]|nr:M67 family metallopeptidase [Puia sp.]
MIFIETDAHQRMVEDAVNNFPDECCGFMLGEEDPEENRIISEILVVDNSKEGDKSRRFEISSKDYLRAEQFAIDRNLSLLGIYHSHPNHPAIPSEHDRKAAQPFFSYVILSVLNNEFVSLRSWRLNEDEQFEEENVKDHSFS